MQPVSTESSLSLRSRLGLVILLLLVAVLAVTPVLDQRAAQNYESLFQRALVTFALARTLNGVISAVQGTEVALQPAGVGVTLTPGELLDPVNDLVERFSWLMLGATVSLGVQQVLLELFLSSSGRRSWYCKWGLSRSLPESFLMRMPNLSRSLRLVTQCRIM